MGDVLKISKDKRHRSSSSLAGVLLEGTRSERKLDLTASIPEVDDQFAVAEARCEDLQDKIDLIKVLKRKRKLKKRSMTRVVDQQMPVPETIPFITVRTQPKKRLMVTEVSQQAARLRRLEVPPNPTRGYLDPATVEQHRMIGQVREYTPSPQQANLVRDNRNRLATQEPKPYARTRMRRSQAEGDTKYEGMNSQGVQITTNLPDSEATDAVTECSDNCECPADYTINTKKATDVRCQQRGPLRRRHVPRDAPIKQTSGSKWMDDSADEMDAWRGGATGASSPRHRRRGPTKNQTSNQTNNVSVQNQCQMDERPVVELFNNCRSRQSPDNRRQTQPASAPIDKKNRKGKAWDHCGHSSNKSRRCQAPQRYGDQATGPLENIAQEIKKEAPRQPRRVKYRSRRYELPTVASQMKQAGMRYYYGASNHTNIPFVVSKSTAPSHNIGVNIQQVLNGIKVQQPLSGIPLTIAHHMGLGHIPTYGTKSATLQPSLDNREINVIKLGHKLLRLPSYKYISYNRLLSLYREGDGMVPRFLRAISRPHYFYTSMYNLATNRDDMDGATSKGRCGSQEAKQSLAEYASLYREYEHIDKCLRDGNGEPELQRRKDELTRELAAREDHIRKVVQGYRSSGEAEQPTLRASASTAEDGYRHSSFKLNLGDPQQ